MDKFLTHLLDHWGVVLALVIGIVGLYGKMFYDIWRSK